MLRGIKIALFLTAVSSANAQIPLPEKSIISQNATCEMLESDRQWLDRSVAAWHFVAKQYGQFVVPAGSQAIIGSAECVLRSDTVLFTDKTSNWQSINGKGKIPIIEDFAMPLSPISQTIEVNGQATFIMSAPSIWRKNNISGGKIGLENLMTAVFIHETSHVLQQKTYVAAFNEIAKAQNLSENFSDDSLQDQFKIDKAYASSIRKETALLLAAARAPSDQQARKRAGQALSLIKARRSKYFVGKNVFMARTEDIFNTLEGSAQWLGYQWLVDPNGGNLPIADAMERFGTGSGFWSQAQGMALLMAVNRLDGGAWKQIAFGDGNRAGIEFLENALKLKQFKPAG